MVEIFLSDEFKNSIRERIEYKYPYLNLVSLAAKRTASDLNESKINLEYFAKEKPAFMGKDSFTPAERGTLIHKFMEISDFSNCEKDAENELERLMKEERFTEKEGKAVNTAKLDAFFKSELYKRMKNAEKIFREQQFTVAVGADYFDSTIDKSEKIVIQGKIDCCFIENDEAVIVDYKTDSVKDENELITRCKTQMDIYSLAVEQFTGKKVKEVILYSFALDKAIKCK